jgi:hypothetical protein
MKQLLTFRVPVGLQDIAQESVANVLGMCEC